MARMKIQHPLGLETHSELGIKRYFLMLGTRGPASGTVSPYLDFWRFCQCKAQGGFIPEGRQGHRSVKMTAAYQVNQSPQS